MYVVQSKEGEELPTERYCALVCTYQKLRDGNRKKCTAMDECSVMQFLQRENRGVVHCNGIVLCITYTFK